MGRRCWYPASARAALQALWAATDTALGFDASNNATPEHVRRIEAASAVAASAHNACNAALAHAGYQQRVPINNHVREATYVAYQRALASLGIAEAPTSQED